MNKIRKETSGERLRKSTALSAGFIFGVRRFVAAFDFETTYPEIIPRIAIATMANKTTDRRIVISPPLSSC